MKLRTAHWPHLCVRDFQNNVARTWIQNDATYFLHDAAMVRFNLWRWEWHTVSPTGLVNSEAQRGCVEQAVP